MRQACGNPADRLCWQLLEAVAHEGVGVAACDEPGASVAKVAIPHGINANVVHRWRQLAREGKAAPTKAGEFIALPLMVTPETAPASADIRVEVRRSPVTMTVCNGMDAPTFDGIDVPEWSERLAEPP